MHVVEGKSVCLLHVLYWLCVDITQERVHTNLIQGVESFRADQLKRTNTLEKVVLPNAQGTCTCPSLPGKNKVTGALFWRELTFHVGEMFLTLVESQI